MCGKTSIVVACETNIDKRLLTEVTSQSYLCFLDSCCSLVNWREWVVVRRPQRANSNDCGMNEKSERFHFSLKLRQIGIDQAESIKPY